MQKLLYLFISALFLISCGENEFADPNKVAEKFLEGYIHMDYEAARKYASSEMQGILDQWEGDKSLLEAYVVQDSKKATFAITDVHVQDAEGIAVVKFTNSELKDIVDELQLKKIDNKWLVQNVERKVDMMLHDQFKDVMDDIIKENQDSLDSEELLTE